MTIREAMQWAQQQLLQSSSPHLDTQLLLCHVLAVEKSHLIAYDDRELSDEELAAYDALVSRRAAGEPVAYILGTKGFYDLDFYVTPAVLIPRPETEHLVEEALEWAQESSGLVAADIGTGSGAIAITVAYHRPQMTVHATDISPDALRVAQRNAERRGVAIHFHEGHLAQPLIDVGLRVDLLMANLPYIRRDEMPHLAVSQYEPHQALNGGEDGLDFIRELLRQAPHVCNTGALMLLEIGADQGETVLNLANATLNPKRATVLKDYAGHDRIARVDL